MVAGHENLSQFGIRNENAPAFSVAVPFREVTKGAIAKAEAYV